MCISELKSYVCKPEIDWANSLAKNNADLRKKIDQLQLVVDGTDLDKKGLAIKLAYYQNEVADDKKSIDSLMLQIGNLTDKTTSLNQQIAILQARIDNLTNTEEALFNKDYPITQEHYQKRYVLDEYKKQVYQDMFPQEYFSNIGYEMNEAKTIVFNKYHPTNEMEIVKACNCVLGADDGLKLVYRSDDYFGTSFNDFWQYPNETITLGKGDCEDETFVWKALCDVCGVPIYKTRAHLGMYGTVGHCYGAYKPTATSKELLLENTMRYPNYLAPLTTLESHPEYTSYFAFNSKLMWKIRDGVTFGEHVEKIWNDGNLRMSTLPWLPKT